MNRTGIEYLDFMWNPVNGCTPVSSGCTHCWAKRMHKRFYDWPFEEVTLQRDRLDEPLRRKKPARIGVCFMGDLLHQRVPNEFIEDVLATITLCPQHTFLILTKRPQRFDIFAEDRLRVSRTDSWPIKNLWLGVSAENQPAFEKRWGILRTIPAAKRFISFEPLLGPIDTQTEFWEDLGDFVWPDWVICGGESGPKARPMHPNWARSLRDQCKTTGIPFFFKQMSGRTPIPDDLMIREFPKC